MLHYIFNRFLQAIFVLLLMTVVVFLLARAGGDPLETMLPEQATEQQKKELAVRLGLDKPLYEQYWMWIKLVARGDLGTSMLEPYPVIELVKATAPKTLMLVSYAMFFALIFGIPLGVMAGVNRGLAVDTIAKTLAILGQSAPAFWIALVTMYFFAIKWHIFPVLGSTDLLGAVLPSFALGAFLTAGITRLTRSAMIEAMESDYITLARAKGLSDAVVIFKHALKNASLPVVTYAAMYFAICLSGVVVVEVVFAWPGIGLLTFRAALGGDFAVLQGTVLLLTAAVVLANLIVDVAYAYIDPRIRYRKA
jgi:peptide/nickel transport system permease protein